MQVPEKELMAIMAARELKASEVVLVGVGIPNLAANLAKRLYHPDIVLIYESGTIDSNPPRQPLSIGDSSLVEDVVSVFSVYEMFSHIIQGGFIDVGFLGAAQIDLEGDINTTVIGDYDSPRARLPGSGGACEIAAYARRKVIITTFSQLKIRKKVDFVTSSTIIPPDEVTGQDHTSQKVTIITDSCTISIAAGGNAEITKIYPGTDIMKLRKEATEIGISISDSPETAETPTEDEVNALHSLDSAGAYLK